MPTLTPGHLARLAFWSCNMVAIRDGRMEWPGFSYTDAEWTRMRELAEPISGAAYRFFVFVNAVVFIAIAAVGIAGIWLPLASLLFPVPAETSAFKFSLLLAASCFLIIGLGLPISLGIAARICSNDQVKRLVAMPLDAALASKVSWQINRIALIMCGLLVPGILLFIAYDIDAGPILTALKWLAIGAMVFSAAIGVLMRGKR